MSQRPPARIISSRALLVWALSLSAAASVYPQTALPVSTVNAAQLVHRILLGTDDLPDGPITTLHVYRDLQQFSVLLLTPDYQLLKKPIDESRFRVSLDSGPLFKPTHVRLAGDDPISLTILIDTTNPDRDLLNALPKAIAGMARPNANQGYLKPHDHFSVYVLGCTVIRTANDLPATSNALEAAMDAALKPWHDRDAMSRRDRGPCVNPAGLWDLILFTTDQLHQQPGRRVLVVVTDGQNRGGRHRWSDALTLAQNDSVAVFGLMKLSDIVSSTISANSSFSNNFSNRFDAPLTERQRKEEGSFGSLCESTGGVEFDVTPKSLPVRLNWWMQALRQRAIVEFPRMKVPGNHNIEVTVPKAKLFIRVSGSSVPLPDPKVLADPTTLPPDPSDAVPVGPRRPLPPR